MSCVQLSEGFSRWFTPLACGPGHPELSKSYMDMASSLFIFTLTFTRLTFWISATVPVHAILCRGQDLPLVPGRDTDVT